MKKFSAVLLALTMAAAPLSAADQSDAVGLVEELYCQFAWEAVIAMPASEQPGLIDQPKAVLEKFFTPDLAKLILDDREEVARSGEVGRLDFLPLWNSQDPSASDLRVAAGSEPDSVAVSFQPVGADERTELLFVTEETPAGVRIADIRYPGDFSLVSLLSPGN